MGEQAVLVERDGPVTSKPAFSKPLFTSWETSLAMK
jgi:hypothetical protein